MCVPQFPSSVTPVCSLPSHLWTVSGSLWSVRLGRSVCPAELWARKVRASQVTQQNWNESELRKRTENDCFKTQSGDESGFLSESLTVSLMILRRLPCGVVWEELRPALVVRNHGWKIHSGTQLHLHQWMLRHTPVQRSCNTCYHLLDWHFNPTSYFILSLVNKQTNIKAMWKRNSLTHNVSLIGGHCSSFTQLKKQSASLKECLFCVPLI